MASQNEASICISSASIAVRNTPQSRCNSATNSGLQIFRPVLPPRLLTQGLQRYDALGAKIRHLAQSNTAQAASQLPANPPSTASILAMPSATLPEALWTQPRSTYCSWPKRKSPDVCRQLLDGVSHFAIVRPFTLYVESATHTDRGSLSFNPTESTSNTQLGLSFLSTG